LLTVRTEVIDWNSGGTAMWIVPMAMVLAAVHGGTSGVPPQFVTVSVHWPATPPVAVVGEIVATNCLTAALALLTPGAAITIARRSMNVARSDTRPRCKMCNFNLDIPSVSF
jgi:hypothetical protein